MNDELHNLNDGLNLEPELAALASELDKLALADMPAPGLEARVYEATLPSLQQANVQHQAAPRLVLVGAQVKRHQRFIGLTAKMRIAAGVALLATVSAAWLANRPASLASSTVQADDWAVMTSIFDDGSTRKLEDLAADTAGLNAHMNSDDQILEEGAM